MDPKPAVLTRSSRLTPRQQRILDFLADYQAARGFAPSFGEIMDGAGVSSLSVVAYNLDRLAEPGLIVRVKGTARAIAVIDQGRDR